MTMAFTCKFVCICLTISSCYVSIPLSLVSKEKAGGLSTLCYNIGFDCQYRVLRKFPGPSYLCSEDGVV